VFTHVLLADEINRAPPRTQSALLEAMAEQQVTLDGQTHPLPDPFFVIATQNPVDLSGTFPLPDSQLDRFLLRLAMGYPAQAERELLRGTDRRDLIAVPCRSWMTPRCARCVKPWPGPCQRRAGSTTCRPC
jgi:MoxR-like ATPase